MQIDRLNLVEETGYSEETIREAFDEMMDYCTKGGERGGQTFGTGSLAWSQSGKDHFDDVEKLFALDINILKISGVVVIIFLGLVVLGKDEELALGQGPLFWGPCVLLGTMTVLGVIGAMDFDRFFEGFHHLFFPGKTNWIFDEAEDEIIRILPEVVFRDFAILILALVIILSILSIVLDFRLNGKGRKKKKI